ncbi:hypothetical protein [Pseudomonas sp. 58 R 3]|nr:hypothetical protein [Pseudomonas sp. 58 R 3]
MLAGLADVVVERHLEQRAQAEAALRLQGLHQLLERQILMGLGFQGALLDLLQQLGNGGLRVDLGLEHLSIDEEADQPFGFNTVAIGDRHADTDVTLAAVAMQQRVVGGQQQHEQRHTFALGQQLEAIEQRGRQPNIQTRPAMGRYRRALLIKRQLQHRLLAAEQFAPVVKLARLFTGFHPVTLPFCVVGVLDRHRRQLQGLALVVGRIELHQFVDQYLHRPAVGDDVMLHQDQHMLVLRQAQEAHTHQRPLAQIERLRHQRLHRGFKLCLVGELRHEFDPRLRADHLHRAVGLLLKMRAQAVVARHQGIEGTLQGAAVQRTFQAQRTGHVIGRAVRVQLPEEPLPFLGIGQQQRLIAIRRHHRRRRSAERGQIVAPRQSVNKVAQHGLLKQRAQCNFETQAMAQAGHHLRGEQRMPAHLEEVIVEPDPFGAQHLGPDSRDALLGLGDRCHPIDLGLADIRLGQRGTVQLAVGAQWQALQHQQMRRNHVVRQLLAQRGLELRAQLSLLGVGQRLVGHDVADQLVVRRDHQRLAHTGLRQQARFDFTQLDTETSHLDLMVDSPHVLDHPIGAITCQVTGAVQTADAVSAEGIGNEAVGRQVRTFEITPRQQRPADHQLARDTYRHRVEVGIQQVNGPAIQHAANRHHRRQGFTALDIRGAVQGSGGHRGFGRPVGVEQSHLLQARCAPGIQPFRRHGFAANVQLAQAPVITWAQVCKVAHQSQPIGRGQVDHGNIVFNQLLVEGVAVPQFATAHHHRRTAAQRRVELLDKTVEVEGAKLQHAVMGLQRKQFGEHLHMPGQGRQVDAHAFWPAGGAGGEHHVGQVGRLRPRLGVFSAVVGQPVCARLQAHKRQVCADRQMLHQRLLGQQ